MKLKNQSIRNRLLLGFSSITIIILIAGLLINENVDRMASQYEFLVEHDLVVLQNAQKLQKLIVDAETGQRGYVITKNDVFLEPYYNAMDEFDLLFDEEIKLVSDNPPQVELLSHIKQLFENWNEKAAIPAIKARRDSTFAYASQLVETATGKNILDKIRKEFGVFIRIENELEAERSAKAKTYETIANGFIAGSILISAILSIVIAFLMVRSIIPSILQLNVVAGMISKGDLTKRITVNAKDELGDLGRIFNLMTDSLEKSSKENENTIWIQNGINKLSDLLRDETDKYSIAEKVINQLVPYLQAQVGAVFFLDESDELLKFTAGYAFKRKKKTNYDLRIGEGLAGQAARDQKTILFTDIPNDYIKVNSALGECTPKNIIAVPLVNNEQLMGVIEIGSVNEFTELQQQLLLRAAKNIAIAIRTIESRSIIQQLFEKAQVQNQELQSTTLELDQQVSAINTAALILITDARGIITYANDRFCRISKYSIEELMGNNPRMLKSDKQPETLFVSLWKVISSGRIWKGEICNMAKGGSYYWVDATIAPFKGLDGKIEKFVSVWWDITARKEQNFQLKEQAEELKVQQEELMDANAMLETQTQELQTSEEELRTQQEVLQESNLELEEKTQLLEEQNLDIIEKNRQLELVREGLKQQAYDLAMSSKYKSEFLANMSHELRTPLNSILLLSRLLSESELNDDQKEYAEVINNSGMGLLELINEVLDLSKVESGKMEIQIQNLDVGQFLEELKTLFRTTANEKGLKFKVNISEEAPRMIMTDKVRFGQILKNLLSNALKFTDIGGVTLRVFKSEKIELEGNSPDSKGVIAFEVTDTGIGIPDDKQKVVFEAFQQADGSTQRKYGGTGLGLSISRKVAVLLGGELHLESKAGEGSTFTLYLPFDDGTVKQVIPGKESVSNSNNLIAEIIPEEIADDRNTVTKKDKPILIIEDDTDFANTLLKLTQERGYKGIVAVRGDKGLEYAQKYHPLAILLDLRLPVKDGWMVFEELKANPKTKAIPVHIMSSIEARQESLLKGAVDFIHKPLVNENFHSVLDNILAVTSSHTRNILMIEDNPVHCEALKQYLGNAKWNVLTANTARKGFNALKKNQIDCIVLDMGLPGASGYDLLEKIRVQEKYEKLPIIIYTGASLSLEEENRIRQYASTIIVKTAKSYQRLKDEISLFLNVVNENNGASKKKRQPYIKDKILDGKTVLIADDDVRSIYSLKKVLSDKGVVVVSAHNGVETLKLMHENPNVEALITDIMMPEMDGYMAMMEIRKEPKWKTLPIIAITAKSMKGERDKCIKAGASDYISKPVDPDQLLSLLRVWLFNNNIN